MMFSTTAIAFLLGLLLQSFIMSRDWRSIGTYLVVFFGAILGSSVALHYIGQQFMDVAVCMTSIIYIVVLFMMNMRNMIPRIGESSLLPYAILLFYVFNVYFHKKSPFWYVTLAVYAMTLFCLWRGFTRRDNPWGVKALLVFWYLVCALGVGSTQVNLDEMSRISFNEDLSAVTLFHFMLSGMVFAYLAGYLLLVRYAFPAGRHDTGYGRRIREYSIMLSSNFDDLQANPMRSLAALVLIGGSLAINHLTNIIDIRTLVTTWLILSPVLFAERAQTPVMQDDKGL
jgi:hypothetical protein